MSIEIKSDILAKELNQGIVPLGVPKAYQYDAALVEAARAAVNQGIDDVAEVGATVKAAIETQETASVNAVSAQEQASKADVNALGDKILAQMKHGYGYPFTAATAAAMADTTKIYVYTGSETGYTNGNWYYWNGTAWTSGGVYNATALETDKTLMVSGTAADAKIIGGFRSFVDDTNRFDNVVPMESQWDNTGYLSQYTGEPIERDNWAYETKYIYVAGITKLTCSYGFAFPAFYDDSHNFISGIAMSATTVTEVNIPTNAVYMRFSWELTRRNQNNFVYLCSIADFIEASKNHALVPSGTGVFAIWGTQDTYNPNDADKIIYNSTYVIQGTTGEGSIDNLPDDWVNDGSAWFLQTIQYNTNHSAPSKAAFQVFSSGIGNSLWYRTRNQNGEWDLWREKNTAPLTIHCGSGQRFTTLKEAIKFAVNWKNTRVIVHPGTYNLNNEFADEIANAGSTDVVGNRLGNGIYLEFMAGSYVTVSFEASNTWAIAYFNPFYPAYQGSDFTLDGLNIYAQNTRYCVHDEKSGVGTYKHVYKNCVMTYKNTEQSPSRVQCIGGGLGQHGLVYIEGESYKSIANFQQPYAISYHNGNNASADSTIFINNVYLADDNRFRFSYYGASKIKSKIYINNCRMGNPTLVTNETSASTTPNMEVLEWNNDIANEN